MGWDEWCSLSQSTWSIALVACTQNTIHTCSYYMWWYVIPVPNMCLVCVFPVPWSCTVTTTNTAISDEDDTSQSTTSSLHVPGPCFSVYELRNKLFQTLSPNAVYIYTYKNQIKSFKLPIHWVNGVHVCVCHVACALYTGFEPSQLSCLGSLVGKSVAWRADGRGFESHPKQPIFLWKMTVLGELCCVALPFCCVFVVVALPFSASLWLIVHVHVRVHVCVCSVLNQLRYPGSLPYVHR